MAFHFLDKDMMRKIITAMTRPKLLKLERIQRIVNKMELEDLTYEERLKEMHLTTLKEKREKGDLIIIYKLMSNLEKTDKNYLILRRKGEARNLRGQEKIAERNLLEQYKKVQFSPKKYRYLE